MSAGRALILAPNAPEYDRESGSRRVLHILEVLRDKGWRLHFMTESISVAERYLSLLREMDIATTLGIHQDLSKVVSDFPPDLAVIFFWELAEKVMVPLRRLSPATKIVVDSVDLHLLRESRGSFRGGKGFLDPEITFKFIRELNVYAGADAVWAVSEKEAALINDLIGDLHLADHLPDWEPPRESIPPFNERYGVLFVANFRHLPNRAALKLLCREIVPLLDPCLLEEHPISIVGNALTPELKTLGEDLPNVHMIGWVPDVTPFFSKARISIAPLPYGAGTKRKLIESLICGTPVVSTWFGAEGLGLVPEKNLLIANDPESFAAAMEKLIGDRKLWDSLSREGRTRITKHHSYAALTRKLSSSLDKVMTLAPKPADSVGRALETQNHWIKANYELMVGRLRLAVEKYVPEGSKLLIVSKGDDQLLDTPGRQAIHFPCESEGGYLGHHPANARWCTQKISELTRKGHHYLAIPAPYLWWLEHYRELGKLLLDRGEVLFDRSDTGLICKLPVAFEATGGKGH